MMTIEAFFKIINDNPDGVTFTDYILGSARSMGAMVDWKDHPGTLQLPWIVNKKNQELYADKLEKAKTELEQLQTLDDDEILQLIDKEFQDKIKERDADLTNCAYIKKGYTRIISQVKSWEPPTSDHVVFKEFMLQQLNNNFPKINSDLDDEVSYLYVIKIKTNRWFSGPREDSILEWKKGKIKKAKDNIQQYSDLLKEDKAACDERQAWLDALLTSIGIDNREHRELGEELSGEEEIQ